MRAFPAMSVLLSGLAMAAEPARILAAGGLGAAPRGCIRWSNRRYGGTDGRAGPQTFEPRNGNNTVAAPTPSAPPSIVSHARAESSTHERSPATASVTISVTA